MNSRRLVAKKVILLCLVIATSAGCVSSAAGNDKSSGGAPGTGGGTNTGGNSATADSGNDAGAVLDGYVTVGPWKGSGFTATDPGAATIVPSCNSNSCAPPFTGDTFCMQGTVTGRPDYSGFAMLGWNVNQDQIGGSALTWNVPDSGGIIVTVSNPGNTNLRVQLQGTNPHIDSDRWCAPLTSGILIPWSSFVTDCWTTGGAPLTPGTPIQQAAILVPGTLQDLPFSLCLVDIQIQ